MKKLKNLFQNLMIFHQVMMKPQKNHRNQIKKKHGKLRMFIKQVLKKTKKKMMMMMKILILDDLGR